MAELHDIICVYFLKINITTILAALNNFYQYNAFVSIVNGVIHAGLTGLDVVLCAGFACGPASIFHVRTVDLFFLIVLVLITI
ncbi:unnamed protein product [Meloidogyne enterolobii]|uniref:Uncharacterized protein n=1 Tax=Meloidogyne enterolobii TaxID=390850 RepID=A0ACB0Y581_MELEN